MNLAEIGIIIVFLGVLLILIGSFFGGKEETKFGFGGFIGPIPFGFANDPRILVVVLIVALLLFLFVR